ncbi:RNA polymerase II subunit B1 CTD phosphatase Rpap2, partial [Trachymyrmex septentrionalis]
LRFISKTHMEVAIDERARRRTCGYVLCSERLTTVHPQLAHDEEDSGQRQFCSLFCRKAANFLLKQMFKTIWWRDDGDIPVFKILPRISKYTETCDFKNCASRCNLP